MSSFATRKGVEVCTTRKGNLLGRRQDPELEWAAAYVIPESDHASDSGPAVLAKPVHYRCPYGLC